MDAFLRDDAQASRLELGVDRTGEVAFGRVGFDDRECALNGHGVPLLIGICGLLPRDLPGGKPPFSPD